jgi:hypothetical protein
VLISFHGGPSNKREFAWTSQPPDFFVHVLGEPEKGGYRWKDEDENGNLHYVWEEE